MLKLCTEIPYDNIYNVFYLCDKNSIPHKLSTITCVVADHGTNIDKHTSLTAGKTFGTCGRVGNDTLIVY